MGFSQHKITTNYTQTLADYIYNTQYEDIPAEVIERAKVITTQVIGVSLAAKNMADTQKAIALTRLLNGGTQGEATGWVSGDRLSLEQACLLNGTLADIMDWEDCSCTGHPSAGVIPMAWTFAEALHMSGKEMLTAIVVGWEVYQRIAMAVQPSPATRARKGWGLVSWQIFGALVPALKLMGHSPKQINQALGTATTCSVLPTGLHEFTKSSVYHFEHGFRNYTAATLARCTKLGIEEMEDGLDDFNAYGNIMSPDAHHPEWYTRELGSRYMIMETLLKHWPANMWVQLSVEIAYNLVTQNHIEAEDIEEIIISPGTERRMDPVGDGFDSLTHAQFNIPYVVAAMIYNRVPGDKWYAKETLKDPKVIALANRVKASDEPMDSPQNGFALFCKGDYPDKTVIIRTKDGRTFSDTMRYHPGHPANMMDRGEISSRFHIQTSLVMDDEKADRALEALWNIENCEDIAALSWMLH